MDWMVSQSRHGKGKGTKNHAKTETAPSINTSSSTSTSSNTENIINIRKYMTNATLYIVDMFIMFKKI
jgi:hypothetical protein